MNNENKLDEYNLNHLIDLIFDGKVASTDSIHNLLEKLATGKVNKDKLILMKYILLALDEECISNFMDKDFYFFSDDIKNALELNKIVGDVFNYNLDANKENFQTNLFSSLSDHAIPDLYKSGIDSKFINILCPNIYRANTAHLNAVLTYAFSLALLDEVERINVTFTFEWLGMALFDDKLKENQVKNVLKYIDEVSSQSEELFNVKDKIFINYPIINNGRVENFNDILLNGPVIKFKGASYKNGTYIFERQIYNNYPTLTATFNSNYKSKCFSDILLSRVNQSDSKVRYFTPPTFSKLSNNINVKLVSKLVTAFTLDRIRNALESLSKYEWNEIEKLLSVYSNWDLVGVPDISKGNVSKIIRDNLSSSAFNKVRIFSKKEIDDIFDDESVFFVLPNIGGGGNTAAIAMAKSVPVVVIENKMSDISNNTPHENRCLSFDEVISVLKKLNNSYDFLNNYLMNQGNYVHSRSDLKSKGTELFGLICESISIFKERRKNECN